jgi:hypothetical protein
MISANKERITLSLHRENVEWLKAQAPGGRTLSECFDAMVQKFRTTEDPAKRLERIVARLERALQ